MTRNELEFSSGTTLLGNAARPLLAAELEKRLSGGKVAYSVLRRVRGLVPSTCSVVDSQIAGAIAQILDWDVIERLAACWVRYREVNEACARTRGDAFASETVPLHARRITSTYHPEVVITAGTVRHPLVFDLTVVYEIVGLAADVRAGQVQSFRGGRCTATATLALGASVLATWSLAPDISAVVAVPRQVSR